MTDSDHTQPPEALGEKGLEFWTKVTSEFDLKADEELILSSACRSIDHIAALEAALVGQDLIVLGSMKQPVANPLLVELRQYRSALASLLRQLKLPGDDEDQEEPTPKREGPMSRSESARIAANTRHHGNPWGKKKR